MPVHVRLSLPDRPGALAMVARVVAGVGADIRSIEVLAAEGGRAIDDLIVDWPADRPLALLVEPLAGYAGLGVLGARRTPSAYRTRDVDLALQLVKHPARAYETVVDALPGVLRADWAALVATTGPWRAPLHCTPGTTLPLPRLTEGPQRPHQRSVDGAHVIVVPLDDLRVVVARDGDPRFVRAEIDHAAALVALAAALAEDEAPAVVTG